MNPTTLIAILVGLTLVSIAITLAALQYYRQHRAQVQYQEQYRASIASALRANERIEHQVDLVERQVELSERQVKLWERQVEALEKMALRQDETMLLLRQIAQSVHNSTEITEVGPALRRTASA